MVRETGNQRLVAGRRRKERVNGETLTTQEGADRSNDCARPEPVGVNANGEWGTPPAATRYEAERRHLCGTGLRPPLNAILLDEPEQIERILKLSSETIIQWRCLIGPHRSDEGITVLRTEIRLG